MNIKKNINDFDFNLSQDEILKKATEIDSKLDKSDIIDKLSILIYKISLL